MPNQPLLIAIDLDGTLLTEQKTISPRTKQTLHQAMDQRHTVVIATGRPYRACRMYYEELQLHTPIVNFNGALVHHPRQPDWGVFHSPIERKIAQQVIKFSEDFGVKNIMIEVMDEVYLRTLDEGIIQTFIDPPNSANPLPKELPKDPTSILIYPYTHHVNELRTQLEEAHAEVIEHRRWGAPWDVIEVVRAGLNKAVGLKHICSALGFEPKNVIAFGDEENDIEMIQFAGIGVAMQNAIPELKETADQITRMNEDDGIAHFLERYVL